VANNSWHGLVLANVCRLQAAQGIIVCVVEGLAGPAKDDRERGRKQ
jgi:hypothetical protein